MRIRGLAASADTPKAAKLDAALLVGILAVLITGAACTRHPIEVVNETTGTITVRTFIDQESYPPSTHEVAASEILTLDVGSLEQRWEISDENGVVLMEVVVSSDLVDFYDGRIVVR